MWSPSSSIDAVRFHHYLFLPLFGYLFSAFPWYRVLPSASLIALTLRSSALLVLVPPHRFIPSPLSHLPSLLLSYPMLACHICCHCPPLFIYSVLTITPYLAFRPSPTRVASFPGQTHVFPPLRGWGLPAVRRLVIRPAPSWLRARLV